MSTFQLTQEEITRRDSLIEDLRDLGAQLESANSDLESALDERQRIAEAYNETAEDAHRFFAEVVARMDEEEFPNPPSALMLLDIDKAEEIELKVDDRPDHDEIFENFEQLLDGQFDPDAVFELLDVLRKIENESA